MNKKILIGSIVMVTVLIGVSFTSVVSYGSVKSTSTINSPLFNMRSQRAIGKESRDMVCDYVGKDVETNIPLSNRIQRTEQVQKAIDIISKMDDKAFSNLIARIILQQNYQEKMTNKEITEVSQTLHYLRKNPNDMEYYDTENSPPPTLEYITCFWFPGCNIICIIIEFLAETLLAIIGWITNKYTCMPPVCPPTSAPPTRYPCC